MFATCLYDLGLLLILPISFMVESQFHHGIRAGYPRVKSNSQTRSTSPSCCPHVGLKIRHTCGSVLRVVPHRLENPPHMWERVESCPTSVRDNVCYVLI
ncbi:hypothetical protein DVH24_034703 [Malus domestica]|uniref:Secreted protein n=1 Tax=Malus domestica TaxID=3750 RepID=A0A498J1U8_MALDO|nr:hypothetical protein DVH24_034703 [Malus domestica]